MKNFIKVLKGERKLIEYPIKFSIFSGFIASVLVSLMLFIFVILGVDYSNFTNSGLIELGEEYNHVVSLIASLIMAPIFETFLFQFGIMHVLGFIFSRIIKDKTNKKARYIIPGIIACIVFALNHNFSVYYIILIFIPSILFQYIIIKSYLENAKHSRAFLYTVICHFSYNLSVSFTNVIALLSLYFLGKNVVI